MKKIITLLIFLTIFTTKTVYGEEILYDKYVTDLGFTINSYCENWTGHRLVEVYEEFKKNTYGEEVEYLKEINLYSHHPSNGKEEGIYNASYKRLELFGNSKVVLSKNNSINLYNMGSKRNVEEFAKTLSHEYGHHFTLYYLVEYESKTFEQWQDTQLYKLRNLKDYSKVTNDYTNGHEWSFTEICAEDYVQLYGSPTAKKIYFFEDIQERYYSNTINKDMSYQYSTYNLNPQENMWIPLVLETPEVKLYWEKATGISSDVEMSTKPSLALVDIIDLGYSKKQYKIRWTKSVDKNNNEAKYYSLIATTIDGSEIIPIKTVEQGETLEAIVGSVKMADSKRITFYTDSFIEKPLIFKVYAIGSSYGVVSSQGLEIDFNHPQITDIESQYSTILPEENTIQVEESTIEESSFMDRIVDFLFFLFELTNLA